VKREYSPEVVERALRMQDGTILAAEVARLRKQYDEQLRIVTEWLDENGIEHGELLVRLGTSGLLGGTEVR
jgi:hypothetical protein